MKFIHTSDWHVGRGIRGKERFSECAELLDEMALFAEKESVDLVIIAGDLFDVHTPPAEAEKIVHSFLVRMNRSGIPVLVIAGNHDSYDRFDSRSDLFSIANISVTGKPRRDAHWRGVSKRGERIVVACMPFLSPRFLLKAGEIFEKTDMEMKLTYSEKVGRMIEILSREFVPDAINILVSHLFLQGAIPSYTEREIDTSALYAVTAPAIPANASYVALGHIHKLQQLERSAVPTYYSGSPLKLDFGEENDQKGFLFVQASPGIPPIVERIPLESVRSLITLEVDFQDLASRASEFRKLIGNGYGRIHVKHNHPIPHLAEIIQHEIPEAVAWSVILPMVEDQPKKSFDIGKLSNPVDVFQSYAEEVTGHPPEEELINAFRKLYDEVQNAPD